MCDPSGVKALILAAGFGTRLRPHTGILPKPLFPVDGRPVLDLLIRRLAASGCRGVAVNTHHLHHRIEAFLAHQEYGIPVLTRFEPEILGTGGAIRNLADFWDDEPFLVVNGDILIDIDFRAVLRFHRGHPHPATLVLCDDPEFNTVRVDEAGRILRFSAADPPDPALRPLTFTGVQVLDPEILQRIPAGIFSSSITAYEELIREGRAPRAFIPEGIRWRDLGTPDRYRREALERMAWSALESRWPGMVRGRLSIETLQGDGSDRSWYRISAGPGRMILGDHGLRRVDPGRTAEVDAFIRIGEHLFRRGIPVPEIYRSDPFSGLVFLEDLGDTHLQDRVRPGCGGDEIMDLYRRVIDGVVRLSVVGARGFDTAWTCQTPAYDRELILKRECRYFVEAFLRGHLGRSGSFASLDGEFWRLADGAARDGFQGLMHRDMQSRNIMVKGGAPRFIDFQGARWGPIQYDLASLLIDPYVDLPAPLQDRLARYAEHRLSQAVPTDGDRFRRGLAHCRITRNLQILGAFAFLSRQKGKKAFEAYIPAAVRSLKRNLARIGSGYPNLAALVDGL